MKASTTGGVIDYTTMTYGEMFLAWSGQGQFRDYNENDLRSIHRRWRSLGKQAAAGRL